MPTKLTPQQAIEYYCETLKRIQRIGASILNDNDQIDETELKSVNIEIKPDVHKRAAIQAIEAGVGREYIYAKCIEYATADPHFLEWVIFGLNPSEDNNERV